MEKLPVAAARYRRKNAYLKTKKYREATEQLKDGQKICEKTFRKFNLLLDK